MRIRVTRRTDAHIEQAAAWWEENRPLAQGALHEELAAAFYRVRGDLIEILALWHTSRGVGPPV